MRYDPFNRPYQECLVSSRWRRASSTSGAPPRRPGQGLRGPVLPWPEDKVLIIQCLGQRIDHQRRRLPNTPQRQGRTGSRLVVVVVSLPISLTAPDPTRRTVYLYSSGLLFSSHCKRHGDLWPDRTAASEVRIPATSAPNARPSAAALAPPTSYRPPAATR
jgi:hypothetical protein